MYRTTTKRDIGWSPASVCVNCELNCLEVLAFLDVSAVGYAGKICTPISIIHVRLNVPPETENNMPISKHI